MPGPCSAKRKSKQQAKKARKNAMKQLEQKQESQCAAAAEDAAIAALSPAIPTSDVSEGRAVHSQQSSVASATPPPLESSGMVVDLGDAVSLGEEQREPNPDYLKRPFIEDPGNGPRVKDTTAFLSSFFAPPPSLGDPQCAAFADAEVLDALRRLLPEEVALILWYNKTRKMGRICPACQRLYRLGDVLPDHVSSVPMDQPPPHVLREQQISGLCSSMCFIVASFNYPSAISASWGKMAEELDAETCDLLNGPGQGLDDQGLGLLLRLTRLHDMGLRQMGCFKTPNPPNHDWAPAGLTVI